MTVAAAGAAPPRPVLLYWAILVGGGVAWGFTGPLSKVAVSTGHHPVGLTFWSTVIAVVLLNGALYARGGRLRFDRRHIVFYLICGLLGTALPNSLSYETYNHLPVGVIAMVLSLVPMGSMALGLIFKQERAEPLRIFGVALGAAAIALIVLPGSALPEPGQAAWVLISLIVALCYSAEGVYMSAKTPGGVDALRTMCGLSLGALVLLSPVAFSLDAVFDITAFGPAEQAAIAITGLHLTAYFGYIWLIPRAGPAFASLAGYIVTGTGVLLGVLIYDERHSLWVWAALVLLAVGIALVRPRR